MTRKQSVEDAIRERRELIKAHQSRARVAQSNIENPQAVERMIADRERTIAQLTAQVDQLRSSLTDGPAIIADARRSVKRLEKEVQFLEHQGKINKLLELQAAINTIGG